MSRVRGGVAGEGIVHIRGARECPGGGSGADALRGGVSHAGALRAELISRIFS